MNERIRELYEQAHEEQSPISGQGRLTKDILWEQPKKFNLEKFAELIVRECADIALKKGMASPDTDFRTGSYVINQYLLTHFGVEE